jgi:putative oxidoreductase
VLLIPILLGAIYTVHGSAGFFFDNANGGWEYPAFWIVALLTQALLGDGAFALNTARYNRTVGVLAGNPSR